MNMEMLKSLKLNYHPTKLRIDYNKPQATL